MRSIGGVQTRRPHHAWKGRYPTGRARCGRRRPWPLLRGLDGAIEFREGDAEALPLADEAYDVTVSSTVMEDVNADRMMAELVRVTRPGAHEAVARPGYRARDPFDTPAGGSRRRGS